MSEVVHTSGPVVVTGEASGRVGDYSPNAYVVISVTYDTNTVNPKEFRVFVGIDQKRYHEAPNPCFTTSGGYSRSTYAVLLEITEGVPIGSRTTLKASKEGRLQLLRNSSGDYSLSSVDHYGRPFYNEEVFIHVVSEGDEYFSAIGKLFKAMQEDGKGENVTNTRNPFRMKLVPENLKLFE
jgi:hypothetical protein